MSLNKKLNVFPFSLSLPQLSQKNSVLLVMKKLLVTMIIEVKVVEIIIRLFHLLTLMIPHFLLLSTKNSVVLKMTKRLLTLSLILCPPLMKVIFISALRRRIVYQYLVPLLQLLIS